ncbi:Spy/CpxP family protein refolding chaperone [bacterium]|nr:Spy/CpxP family protein refolding chaperone [bacterium]
MKHLSATMLVAAMAASIQLSGCGRIAPGPVQAPQATVQTERTTNFFVLDAAASSNAQALSTESTHARILSQLDLSDTQKTQLKLIRAKARALYNREEMKARWQTLEALMNAPTLDTAALKAYVASMEAEHKGKIDALAALAGEMRDVLTSEQRDKLVSLVSEQQPGRMAARARSAIRTNVINALNLSSNQQNTLSALQNQMEAQHEVKRDAKRKAFIEFIVDGNQLALAENLKRSMGHENIDEAIQWVGSLSQDQRKVLVEKLGEIKQRHMARMMAD